MAYFFAFNYSVYIVTKMMVAVLYNRQSAKGKAKKIAESLYALNSKLHLFSDDLWPSHLDDYSEIWLIGGDGTVNYFINKYENVNIPLVIFPGGTGNDIHWKLYGNLNWKDQYKLIDKLHTTKVDIGYCNQYRFLNGIGIGFDGEVLKSMKAIRSIGGHLGYLLVVLKNIFTFKEVNYSLDYNGKSFYQQCLLLSVANSSRTGGGFLVSPKADVYDGWLNLFYCKPLGYFKRLSSLPKVEKGTHLDLPFVEHELLKNITIRSPYVIAAQVDGELIESDVFNIHVVASGIRIKCLK